MTETPDDAFKDLLEHVDTLKLDPVDRLAFLEKMAGAVERYVEERKTQVTYHVDRTPATGDKRLHLIASEDGWEDAFRMMALDTLHSLMGGDPIYLEVITAERNTAKSHQGTVVSVDRGRGLIAFADDVTVYVDGVIRISV